MSGRARALCIWGMLALLATAGCGAPDAPAALEGVPPVDLSTAESPVVAAIDAASRDARRLPESAIVWGHLGYVYDAHGYFPQAVACYRRALELSPDDFRWNYHLAVILDLEAADLDEIIGLFETAARLRPDYTPVAWRHARALGRRGRHEEARAILARAMERDPDFAAGQRSLGQVLLSLGDASGAVLHLERATELDPQDGTAFAALAQAYRLAGQPDAAAATAMRARNLKPKLSGRDPVRFEVSKLNVSSVGLARRATSTMNAGRHAEAIPLFERSLEMRPDSSSSHHNLGVCLIMTGRTEDAAEHFEKSIAIDDDAGSHVKLGVLLLRQGDTTGALEHFRRADAARPDDAVLQREMGTALAGVPLFDEALARFERAAALDPDHPVLQNNWGSMLFEAGRIEDALARFRRAIELNPGYAMGWFNVGMALERLERADEAAEHYRRALELDPALPAQERLDQL